MKMLRTNVVVICDLPSTRKQRENEKQLKEKQREGKKKKKKEWKKG